MLGHRLMQTSSMPWVGGSQTSHPLPPCPETLLNGLQEGRVSLEVMEWKLRRLMKPVLDQSGSVEWDTVPDADGMANGQRRVSLHVLLLSVSPGLIYEELFRFRRLIGSSVSYFERQRLEMSKKSIKFLKTLRQVFLQTVWGLEWACSWGNLGFAPWVSNSTFCIYELFISV